MGCVTNKTGIAGLLCVLLRNMIVGVNMRGFSCSGKQQQSYGNYNQPNSQNMLHEQWRVLVRHTNTVRAGWLFLS